MVLDERTLENVTRIRDTLIKDNAITPTDGRYLVSAIEAVRQEQDRNRGTALDQSIRAGFALLARTIVSRTDSCERDESIRGEIQDYEHGD